MRKKTERIGEQAINKQGMLMEITKYDNNKDVTVTFVETGETVKCSYIQFKKRDVKATVFPVGKTHITITVITYLLMVAIGISLLAWGVTSLFS